MTKAYIVVSACLVLAVGPGCARIGQSRLNPLNWFAPRTAEINSFSIQRPADPRPLIEMIVSGTLEPLPSGAVVRATGRAASQGYWQANLVVAGLDDAGDLVIEFRAFPALDAQAAGGDSPPRTREITAAVSLRADTLASAKRIVLRGAQNEKTLRP